MHGETETEANIAHVARLARPKAIVAFHDMYPDLSLKHAIEKQHQVAILPFGGYTWALSTHMSTQLTKMYILIPDDIPLGHAINSAAHASLACYLQFKDDGDMKCV
jgi:hypothetical protein